MDDQLFFSLDQSSPDRIFPSPPPASPKREIICDLGIGDRIENNGTSQEVHIPEGAEAFWAFSENGVSRLELSGAMFTGGIAPSPATSESTLVVFNDLPLGPYPLAPGQRLFCYGNAVTVTSFRFLGRIRV
mgnify:CR=1 FL=1